MNAAMLGNTGPNRLISPLRLAQLRLAAAARRANGAGEPPSRRHSQAVVANAAGVSGGGQPRRHQQQQTQRDGGSNSGARRPAPQGRGNARSGGPDDQKRWLNRWWARQRTEKKRRAAQEAEAEQKPAPSVIQLLQTKKQVGAEEAAEEQAEEQKQHKQQVQQRAAQAAPPAAGEGRTAAASAPPAPKAGRQASSNIVPAAVFTPQQGKYSAAVRYVKVRPKAGDLRKGRCPTAGAAHLQLLQQAQQQDALLGVPEARQQGPNMRLQQEEKWSAGRLEGQRAPAFTADALGYLEKLGLSRREAEQALQEAHSAAAALAAAAADPEADIAGAATPTGAPGGQLRQAQQQPIDGQQVEQACKQLLELVQLPLVQLPRAIKEAPEVLVATEDDLDQQVETLASVWGSERAVLANIKRYPAMLSSRFLANLNRSLQALSSLGFSREQVVTAILTLPEVTEQTRDGLVATLTSAGIDLDSATGEVLDFLASHPQYLLPSGAPALQATLRLLGGWGLPRPLQALALARCPALLRTEAEELEEIASILLGFGMTGQQFTAIVLGFPAVLRSSPTMVRLHLKFLSDFDIPIAELVRYPRLFLHDPVDVLGPRLAYLASYDKGKLGMRLTSICARTDEDFAMFVAKQLPEHYLTFKERWLEFFNRQVGGQAQSSSQGVSKKLITELTANLWN